MTLIEGIGDEVTQFFIGLFAIVIVCLAWWTTNISEQRHVRTVLLLDRRRRATSGWVPLRLLTNRTETVSITGGATTVLSTVSEETPSFQTLSTVDQTPSTSSQPEKSDEEEEGEEAENLESDEQSEIIQTMDADQNVVRQRRLAFCMSNTENTEKPREENISQNFDQNVEGTENKNGITIKLKYINDDLKLVDGRLEELLGDFKRRHFQREFAANKVVRLIFNGQVLQQDGRTLQSCGLFDNCVVHCLVHQKRATANDDQTGQNRQNDAPHSFGRDGAFMGTGNNARDILRRDWDLANFMFASISFILMAAWYFRYVYAHLYTITATGGLILMTGIFTVVLVGMYFGDNEEIPNPSIRVGRAERVEPQQ